jgi:hypothetical protein
MIGLSIAVVFLLLIPATFVGGIAKLIYLAAVGHYLASDGLINWISGGWFDRISLAVFPNLLHGAVAGALAIYVASRILRRVTFETAAYAVSSLVVLIALIGGLFGFAKDGFGLELVELVANTAGIIAGLFLTAQGVDQDILGGRQQRAS